MFNVIKYKLIISIFYYLWTPCLSLFNLIDIKIILKHF